MSEDKIIIEEIEKICGVKFKWLNMPRYTEVENWYMYNEQEFIITLGLDLAKLNLDEFKLSLLGENIKKLKRIDKFLLKLPKGKEFPKWFAELSSIKELIIKHSHLSNLPEVIREFKNLEHIDLEDNELERLPEWLKELEQISFLNLKDNRIIRLPNWLLSLSKLSEIELETNTPQLELNQENIDVIKNLLTKGVKINSWIVYMHANLNVPAEQVKLIMNIRDRNGNNIVRVDTMESLDDPYRFSYYECVHTRIWEGKIRQIAITDNPITELPEQFSKIEGLNYLKINFSQLESLPKSFGHLIDLKELDLSNNKLSVLPDSFANLTSLTRLNLSNNEFSEIPTILWALTELTEINLDNNSLSSDEIIIAQKVPDLIRKYLRKKATIIIFISHAVVDFENYRISEIIEYLENQKEISQVFFCEENLAGNIDQWMLDTVQKCHLVLFIATNKSLFNSPDCANELQLADKFSIPVIPIKGYDVDWPDLMEKNLSRELGVDFDKNNFTAFCENLYKYIENFKREINLMEKDKRQSGIVDIYERFRLLMDDKLNDIQRKIEMFVEQNEARLSKLEEQIIEIMKKMQDIN